MNQSSSATFSFTFRPYCTLSSSSESVSGSLAPGAFGQIGQTVKLTIACNDPNGYSLYANGLSSSDEPGHTDLVGTSPTNIIKTGTASSGDTSNWNFILASSSEGLSISEGFDSAHDIPDSNTLVASRASGLSAGSGDIVDVSYSAYISPTQPADTYAAQVSYFLLQLATPTVESMQNFSCSSLAADQTTTLFDARDGNTYTVAKLKDGKCWMTENLRLGKASGPVTLTPTDSDVSAEYTLPASSSTGFTSGQSDTAWAYVDGTYGGYYSWIAATAGTGTSSMSSGNASSSICSKGWHLPTGGSDGEIEALAKKYGSGTDQATVTALKAKPAPSFILSGYYLDSTLNYQGSRGYIWSSTAYNSATAYHLSLYASSLNPTQHSYKSHGFAVRCVAE